MTKKVKDLSLSKRPKTKGLKEMVGVGGTIHLVPYAKWKNEVLDNPMGVTATRARMKKDKDLKHIKIKVQLYKLYDEEYTPDSIPEVESKATKKKDFSLRNLSKEKAKQLGFRSEKDGKGFKLKTKAKKKT